MNGESIPLSVATQEASVDHEPGFSESRTRLQWITHQALVEQAPGFSGVGGGGVLEPVAKSWESPAGNSVKFWDFCIIRRQSRPENCVM